MDKYEYNQKLEEIHKLLGQRNYEEASRIVDTIDWKRVKNARTLCMVSEVYEAVGRLDESKEILLRAYQSSQIRRVVLFRLTEVAIKREEFDEAVEYYSEFVDVAPKDTTRYILKYKIYHGRGSSLEDQIQILEEYKDIEYTEQWSYELARLYYEAGETKKCIETCDDLVLWFRQGEFVIKALELKRSVTDLSPMQQTIYDHRDDPVMKDPGAVEDKIPELEKVILEGMPASQEEAITDNIITETQRELAQAVTQHAAEPKENIETEAWDTTVPFPDVKNKIKIPETTGTDNANIDIGDLQQDLAKSMREIVSEIRKKESDTGIIEPMNDKLFTSDEAAGPDIEEEMDDSDDNIKGQVTIDDILTSMAIGSQSEAEPLAEPVMEPVPDSESEPQTESADEPEPKSEPIPQPEPEQPSTIDLSEALEAAAGITDMKPNMSPDNKPDLSHEERIQYKLLPEERYLFSFFSSIQGMEEQITSTIYELKRKVRLDKTSKTGNIVITGPAGSGRTNLGIRFAKAFSKLKGEEAARIARIYAEDFNKKDIPATVAKIAGGTLIIEKACSLDDGVVKILSKAMEFKTDGLLIILEDESGPLEHLFDRHPEFADKFTSELSVPIYTNDELVTFGKTYAYDEDYKIDDMATLALYNRIGEMQNPDRPVNICDVKEIIDKAIKRSERVGLRKLGMILSKKRYDKDDRIILYEKDFK